jgi:hypothetical protein
MKQNKTFIKHNTSGIETVVLRVFDKKTDEKIPAKVLCYASSRLGSIRILPDGFEIDVPAELEGKDFELKTLPEKKVIVSGKIECLDVPEVKEKVKPKSIPEKVKDGEAVFLTNKTQE